MGMGSKANMRGSGSSKRDDDAKVVGIVISTQISTSFLKTIISILLRTKTTTKPLTKGVVISSGVGGLSSSKTPPFNKRYEE